LSHSQAPQRVNYRTSMSAPSGVNGQSFLKDPNSLIPLPPPHLCGRHASMGGTAKAPTTCSCQPPLPFPLLLLHLPIGMIL
jgi:hypothetical protein